MTSSGRSHLYSYFVAVLSVALGIALRLALNPLLGDRAPFLFLVLAVMFSAWWGGFGAGIAATGLAMVAGYTFFPAPRGPLSTPLYLDDAVRLTSFLLIGLSSSALIDALHRARRRAEENAHEATAREQSLARQNERLRLLAEAAEHLLSSEEPEALVPGVFQKLSGHLGLCAYFNYMVDEQGDALRLASCAGIPAETAREIERLEFGQAVCGTVAAQQSAIVATGIQQSDDPQVQLVKGFGVRAYVCNPLIVGERLLGTLSFAANDRDRFSDDELELVRTICHYVAIARERQRLVAEVRQRVDALVEADRRKDDFLAMLGHELRTPLSTLTGVVHLSQRQTTDNPALGRLWERMERQVCRLAYLVDDMQDVSRIVRGKLALEVKPFDLVSLVRQTVEDHRHSVEDAKLTLDVALPAPPILVHGDRTRLAQVLGNLLTNATKFTDAGGQVDVEVTPNGRQVAIRVRDSGIGIEPALLPRLFESFAQGERSLDRSRGGLGLGLALVKGIVALHQGEISAHSEGPGRGAEFTVWLPLVKAQASRAEG